MGPMRTLHAVGVALAALTSASAPTFAQTGESFEIVEATFEDIQSAIRARRTTATDVVNLYLARIRDYNGTCVNQPSGILGPVTPITGTNQLNALMTLNLRPAVREKWGFEPTKARSLSDADDDPNMLDALEVAAAQDAYFARTGELVGPLHGIVFSVKDTLDTYDMRTTSGGAIDFANDRPPADATVVARLRAAGAIILAKANLGEYASGSRTAFGGTICNAYDRTRDPGGSSGGSAVSAAANLVTCAISEEGGPSIRMPSRLNNVIGLSASQGLVSRDGQLGAGSLNDRTGPACRTVADTARVLDVIAGWDVRDDLTAYAVGRIPREGYLAHAQARELAGVTIGVVREYMNLDLFTAADRESVELVEAAVADLRGLGATIVDPGPGGDLMTACIRQYLPVNTTAAFIDSYPGLFPDGVDEVAKLIEIYQDPSLIPSDGPTLRDFNLAGGASIGERRYWFERYLANRGDAKVKALADLIAHSQFYVDDMRPDARGARTRFRDVRGTLENAAAATTMNTTGRNANRYGIQQTVMHCMQVLGLDALTYPTGNITPAVIGAVVEPDVNGRSHQAWTVLGQVGFPAMTVPAGFTTQVYDRVRDETAENGSRLVGPTPAALPVGIDFLARPFDESTLFKIASAYEAATQHRRPPDLGQD